VVGIARYLGLYVRTIALVREDDGAPTALVWTLWPGPPLRLRAAALCAPRGHAGRHQGRSSVHAPWTAVRPRGRRWPLIVDDQGEWQVEREDAEAAAPLLRLLGWPGAPRRPAGRPAQPPRS
jgi:hypothetical protein